MTKLKVGDKVRYIRTGVGCRATVGENYYICMTDYGSSAEYGLSETKSGPAISSPWCARSQLVPFDAEDAFKYKVDDKVTYIEDTSGANASLGKDYYIGEVDVSVHDPKVNMAYRLKETINGPVIMGSWCAEAQLQLVESPSAVHAIDAEVLDEAIGAALCKEQRGEVIPLSAQLTFAERHDIPTFNTPREFMMHLMAGGCLINTGWPDTFKDGFVCMKNDVVVYTDTHHFLRETHYPADLTIRNAEGDWIAIPAPRVIDINEAQEILMSHLEQPVLITKE